MLLNTLSGSVPALAREYALPGRSDPRTSWSPRAARNGAARRTTCRADPAGAMHRTTRWRPAR